MIHNFRNLILHQGICSWEKKERLMTEYMSGYDYQDLAWTDDTPRIAIFNELKRKIKIIFKKEEILEIHLTAKCDRVKKMMGWCLDE